jgi:hypothetical protein
MMATPADEKEHILVVEDDRDLRETLCDALRLEGYEVVCVEHGAAALRHLTTGAKPCVILLDLMMPVMDGWTFRQEILKDSAWGEHPRRRHDRRGRAARKDGSLGRDPLQAAPNGQRGRRRAGVLPGRRRGLGVAAPD